LFSKKVDILAAVSAESLPLHSNEVRKGGILLVEKLVFGVLGIAFC